MVVDRDTQSKRLGRSKKLAMIVAAARTIARYRHSRLTICAQGDRLQVDTPLLFVGNNDYDVTLPTAGKGETLDSGKLCVLVLGHRGRLGLVAITVRALLGRSRPEDVVRLDAVEELRVESRQRSITVSVDGEIERPRPPLIYRSRPCALRVIAPIGAHSND